MLQELVNAGLDAKEAKFYLAVLDMERPTVAQVAERAEVSRTNAYDITKRLVHRGLISITEIGPNGKPAGRGRGVLTANDPGHLLEEWAERKEVLDSLVPKLRAMRPKGGSQPRVRYLEGVSGIKSALFETLAWPSPLRRDLFDERSPYRAGPQRHERVHRGQTRETVMAAGDPVARTRFRAWLAFEPSGLPGVPVRTSRVRLHHDHDHRPG